MNKRQKKKRRRQIEVEESSGNVFADIGLPDADRLLADAKLTRLADRDLPIAKRARRAESRIERLRRIKSQ